MSAKLDETVVRLNGSDAVYRCAPAAEWGAPSHDRLRLGRGGSARSGSGRGERGLSASRNHAAPNRSLRPSRSVFHKCLPPLTPPTSYNRKSSSPHSRRPTRFFFRMALAGLILGSLGAALGLLALVVAVVKRTKLTEHRPSISTSKVELKVRVSPRVFC